MVVRNERLLGIDVRAVIAGVHKRRRRDAHVHLRCSRIPKQHYGAAACRAAHNGVVHKHYALALHNGADGVQFDFHLVFAQLLRGRNEGAANIFVLDEANVIRDSGLPGKAKRSIKPRIRRADDDVRLHGVLERQKRAGALTRNVNGAAVQHGIRPGKIDEFKHAER